MLTKTSPGWQSLRRPDGAEADLILSGQVYGVLGNDPALVARLGPAAQAAPYKAPPRAPVLYLKPRNTQVAAGGGQPARVVVDQDVPGFEVGAALGLVFGRTACRVPAEAALDYLAGYLLVVDLTVPHDSYYRPSVRFKARDGSCLLGGLLAPATALDPDALMLDVTVDGRPAQAVSTAGRVRPARTLIADVTDFMTLSRGDILLTGLAVDAPLVAAGQGFVVTAPGLGGIAGHLVVEAGRGPATVAARSRQGESS